MPLVENSIKITFPIPIKNFSKKFQKKCVPHLLVHGLGIAVPHSQPPWLVVSPAGSWPWYRRASLSASLTGSTHEYLFFFKKKILIKKKFHSKKILIFFFNYLLVHGLGSAVPHSQPPWLVVEAVAAGDQLPVGPWWWEPRLKVKLLGRRVVQLSWHDVHHLEQDKF